MTNILDIVSNALEFLMPDRTLVSCQLAMVVNTWSHGRGLVRETVAQLVGCVFHLGDHMQFTVLITT